MAYEAFQMIMVSMLVKGKFQGVYCFPNNYARKYVTSSNSIVKKFFFFFFLE